MCCVSEVVLVHTGGMEHAGGLTSPRLIAPYPLHLRVPQHDLVDVMDAFSSSGVAVRSSGGRPSFRGKPSYGVSFLFSWCPQAHLPSVDEEGGRRRGTRLRRPTRRREDIVRNVTFLFMPLSSRATVFLGTRQGACVTTRQGAVRWRGCGCAGGGDLRNRSAASYYLYTVS